MLESPDDELQALIDKRNENYTDTPISINPKNESFGTEIRVNTQVLNMECLRIDAALLKTLMMKAPLNKYVQTGIFVPRGLAQMTNPEGYKSVLNQQNKFLSETAVIPLLDLFKDVAYNSPPNIPTIYSQIVNDPAVIAMYPTVHDKNNKWFILYNKSHETEVHHLVDEKIPQWINERNSNIKGKGRTSLIPHRKKPKTVPTSALSYAQVLVNNASSDQVYPQPTIKKRPTTFAFTNHAFPPLDQNKKHKVQQQPTTTMDNPSNTNNSNINNNQTEPPQPMNESNVTTTSQNNTTTENTQATSDPNNIKDMKQYIDQELTEFRQEISQELNNAIDTKLTPMMQQFQFMCQNFKTTV